MPHTDSLFGQDLLVLMPGISVHRSLIGCRHRPAPASQFPPPPSPAALVLISFQDIITPTDEGCAVLAKRIKAMTTSALSIVAGVVGATSVQDFVAAASHMSPADLAMLRDEIGRMGLQQTHAPSV